MPRADRTKRAMALLAIVGAATLILPAAAEGRGRPDVSAGAVKAKRGTAFTGSRLRLAARVANQGPARAGRSVVGFYLSRDKSWSSADVPLGRDKLAKLPPRARRRATLRTRVPAAAPRLESLFVLACADDRLRLRERNERNNCATGRGSLTVAGRNSFEAIDAARRARDLAEGQALAYKVFAVFGDRRLPKRFRFRSVGGSGTALMDLVQARLEGLPRKWRNAIAPFLVPPAYTGSFAARAARGTAPDTCVLRQWSAVDAGGLALIWWNQNRPGDQAQAQRLAGELANTIWPKLTGLMGKVPLSDGAHLCSGTDGRLDVYLHPVNTPVVSQFTATCAPAASDVVFPPTGSRGALAHEFMHVLQKTFTRHAPCTEFDYLDDATATWAEDYVYKGDNTEHQYPQMLRYPDIRFNHPPEAGYPAWVLFYSAASAPGRGGAGVVPAFHAAAATQKPLDALNSAMPGGLAQSWPRFARDGWNRKLAPALPESFFSWDRLRVTPEVAKKEYSLQGNQTTHPLPIELLGLGRQYQHIGLSDKKAKLVTFVDPAPRGTDPKLRTHAYYKLASGVWKDADWTGEDEVEFCREKKSEDVREVVLVHSTSTFPKGQGGGDLVVNTDKAKLRLQDDCDLGGFYDVVSVNGSFNSTVTKNQLDIACSMTFDAHWTTTLGPGAKPAFLSVAYRDKEGRPVLAFVADRIPTHEHGTGTGEKTCSEPDPGPNGTATCRIDLQEQGQVGVASVANPRREPMDLEWFFGYPNRQYDPGAGSGEPRDCTETGPRPSDLGPTRYSPGLDVHPLNDPAPPDRDPTDDTGVHVVGKKSVPRSTFGGGTVTLSFSGSGTSHYRYEGDEEMNAQWSYSMVITFRRR